uniref:Uncharacterized protein n=1 Tax=Rhizophora mucronata TaxID=61149 RepID=A0A2P2NIL3_RHIMU
MVLISTVVSNKNLFN